MATAERSRSFPGRPSTLLQLTKASHKAVHLFDAYKLFADDFLSFRRGFRPPEEALPLLSVMVSLTLISNFMVRNQEDFDDDIIKRVEPIRRCSLQIQSSQPETGCRFMYDRIKDNFNFLENRILKFAKDLALGSEFYVEPVNPTVTSQKSIFAVGMICCEEEGRLKEKPVFLQSSVLHSGGQHVRLNIQT